MISLNVFNPKVKKIIVKIEKKGMQVSESCFYQYPVWAAKAVNKTLQFIYIQNQKAGI